MTGWSVCEHFKSFKWLKYSSRFECEKMIKCTKIFVHLYNKRQ